jgi:hypothetical protein
MIPLHSYNLDIKIYRIESLSIILAEDRNGGLG